LNKKQIAAIVVLLIWLGITASRIFAVYKSAMTQQTLGGSTELFGTAQYYIGFVTSSLPAALICAVLVYFLRDK